MIRNTPTFKDTQIETVISEGTIENCHFENYTFKAVKLEYATLINTFFKYHKS